MRPPAAASINVTALVALFSHAVELTNRQRSLGPDSSIMKIYGTELLQSLNDLLVEAAGSDASIEHPLMTEADADAASRQAASRSPAAPIDLFGNRCMHLSPQ